MKPAIASTAALSCLLTLLAVWGLGFAPLPARVVLENPKVIVTEVTFPPGVPRDRGVRGHDQVIVFLDDCRYQRLDSVTQEKTVRGHKAGDVIWHNRGEDAPQLTNLGAKPYRTLVVELK